MLRLYLFRHAKSSFESDQGEDFDRPLASRGRAAARAMATHLAATDVAPDMILCSAARRARETLALALPAFSRDCIIRIARGLYLADEAALLECVRALPDASQDCMLIGHNPGFQNLALLLAGDGSHADLASLRAKFPTAAVSEIHFPLSRWRDVEPGAGRLQRFVLPGSLSAEA